YPLGRGRVLVGGAERDDVAQDELVVRVVVDVDDPAPRTGPGAGRRRRRRLGRLAAEAVAVAVEVVGVGADDAEVGAALEQTGRAGEVGWRGRDAEVEV